MCAPAAACVGPAAWAASLRFVYPPAGMHWRLRLYKGGRALYIYIYIYTNRYIYVYIYICIHIYIYIYI